ncbi:hypothetical protein GGP84_002934 [Salinibacter ruber]|uniref:DNRLRE domain-containing protein n=1 Tax=Salinibacter ruber TaxID=146919 RepID=UPI00216859B0|nr:DNRLRE domain-containing protein [Salinibacter ruber]MCS3940282.1 hypothetical protein [Salinibacter ruber]
MGEPPSVTISTPESGSEFSRADKIRFVGEAEDPETGQITGEDLVWESSTDGVIGTGEEITAVLSADLHVVTLRATGESGQSAEDTVSVPVNGPPTVTVNSPSDESAAKNSETVALEGRATDPVNGDLNGDTLEWSSDVDGTLGTGETVSVQSLSPGPHTIALTATDEDGEVQSDSIDFVVEEPGFDVRFRFSSDLSPAEKTTVRDAVVPWENAITGDLPPYFLPDEVVGEDGFAGKGVDDLAIAVEVSDIDGAGGTLAQAGPRAFRMSGEDPTTATVGVIQIDKSDRSNARLETIIEHEIGHVLGIGTLWGAATSDENSVAPVHRGSSTTSAYEALSGSDAFLLEGVPLALLGGAGTRLAHWSEENFDNELMTGVINSNSENPLSAVSLSALEDIGYEVDQSAADSYRLPSLQITRFGSSADATLSRPAAANQNFGTPQGGPVDSVLVAGSNNDRLWLPNEPEGQVFSSLVRFELPPGLPPGVDFGALLSLRSKEINAETPNHQVSVYSAGASWSESSVTDASRPTRQDSITSFDFQSCDPTCGQDSSPVVTGQVERWLNGESNNGLFLQAPDAVSNSTFSLGVYNRHVQRSPLLRPYLIVFAQKTAGQVQARDLKAMARGKSSGRGELPLGDDILDQKIYGTDPQGNVMKTRHPQR